MRRTHFTAAAALTLLAAMAAPSRPALAQADPAAQKPTAQQVQQAGESAAKAARDPEVVAKLKRAVEAQGDISPYTLKALNHDPLAMEAVGRPAASPPGQAAPAPKSAAGAKGGKAIYGDIIIHR